MQHAVKQTYQLRPAPRPTAIKHRNGKFKLDRRIIRDAPWNIYLHLQFCFDEMLGNIPDGTLPGIDL